MQLSNNTVLITGGGSGIGLALASSFVRRGNQVIICGRNLSRLEKAKQLMPELDIFQCDIAQHSQQLALIQYLNKNHPQINILINNAGIQQNLDFNTGKFPIESIQNEIGINIAAQLELSYRIIPLLKEHSSSSIIFLGSALARVPKQSTPVYCATKAAIHSFAQTLRYQLEKTPIEVFEVIPDLVDTEMTQSNTSKKISATKLSEEVIDSLLRGEHEINIGRTGLLFMLHRFFPKLAYNILKNG